jgi:homoserine/homoserine lactone efflux protein
MPRTPRAVRRYHAQALVSRLLVKPDTWLTFFVAAWLICLSPGPGVLSSVTAGMRWGFRRALWNIVGLEVGSMLLIGTVATGLGAVLSASVFAFNAIKWLGAAYLVWLGIQQWRAPARPPAADDGGLGDAASAWRIFLRGLLINVSNPKAILFTLAVTPQFVDSSLPQWPQYGAIMATLLFTDTVSMSVYTALGARALRVLRDPVVLRWTNRGFGSLFIGAGAALAAFRR